MIRGIYTSASGMVPTMTRQTVAANNLANVNTTGFKRDRAFIRFMPDLDTSLQRGRGVLSQQAETGEVITDFGQGPLRQTGGELDVAIKGQGFFVVDTPQGTRYTRNGNFMMNANGQLVTAQGFVVQGEGGPIEPGTGEVIIQQNGEILADGDTIDTLMIVDFQQPYRLAKLGNSLFVPLDPADRGTPVEEPSVKQGFLEQANVNIIEEMVNMMQIYRNYESDQRAIRYQDETLSKAVNEVGRV